MWRKGCFKRFYLLTYFRICARHPRVDWYHVLICSWPFHFFFLPFVVRFCLPLFQGLCVAQSRLRLTGFLLQYQSWAPPPPPPPADYTIFLSTHFNSIQLLFCPLASHSNIYSLYMLGRFDMTDPYMRTTFTRPPQTLPNHSSSYWLTLKEGGAALERWLRG